MHLEEIDIHHIATNCFESVFRTTTQQPGFIHLDFGTTMNSFRLRELMVSLKSELSELTQKSFNKSLGFQWLGRFDQQATTKYHLDNAGNQSFLMLGYEPSEINSELYLADYVAFCHENKCEPSNYFDIYNPIIKDNELLLSPYASKVESFNHRHFQIILINNSNSQGTNETLGVLHLAKILKKDDTKSRIINSMMLNMDSHLPPDSESDVHHFKTTTAIRK